MRCLLVTIFLLAAGRGAMAEEGKDESTSIEKLVAYLDAQVRAAGTDGDTWPKLDDPKWKALELSNEQVIDVLGRQLSPSAPRDGFFKYALLSKVKLDLSAATDKQIEAILERVPKLAMRPTAPSVNVDSKQANAKKRELDKAFRASVMQTNQLNAPTLAYRIKLMDALPSRDHTKLDFIVKDLTDRYAAGVEGSTGTLNYGRVMDNTKIEKRLSAEIENLIDSDGLSADERRGYAGKIRTLFSKGRDIAVRYKREGAKAVPEMERLGLSEKKRDELLDMLDPKPSLLD